MSLLHDPFFGGFCFGVAMAVFAVTLLLIGSIARRNPEWLAHQFHDTYERLAPAYGYQTRRESAVPWEDVPEPNKRLMIAVCAEIMRP